MLKFKVSETDEAHGFQNDLIAISSSKTTNNIIYDEYNERICENQVDTFINLCKNVSIEGSKTLKSFLSTNSLWDLLLLSSPSEFSIINPSIVHYYFSIPDRVSAVCKMETDEFFFLKNFISWTEESLNQVTIDSHKLERFIYGLEHLDGFAISKISKLDGFWDSLNEKIMNRLSTTSRKVFLAALFRNLLLKDFPFTRIHLITQRLCKNMKLTDTVMSELFMDKFITEGTLDYRDFARILVVCTSNNFIIDLLERILKIWSNDSWIIRTPFNSQLHYSSCLMSVLSLISPDLFNPELEQSLMNGVQRRLDHSDAQVRLMATCVAEMLNQFHPEAENKLDFELDMNNEIVAHLNLCKSYTDIHTEYSVSKQYKIMPEPTEATVAVTNDSAISESDDDDLKPISSLLKEELNPPKNSKTPLPRFLPDCLRVLRSNDDADLVEKVLQNLPKIFAASPKLSRQMHAASAFNTLLTISDQFSLTNFDQLRLDSMQLVFLDQIKIVAPEIIDNLFKSNKLVLGQKMELLSLISSSSANTQNRNDFVDSLYFPLLTNSIRNFHLFQRSHVMFLEKFLWLQGILLNYSKNSLSFERIVEKYFDLVHLTLGAAAPSSTHKLIEQVPVQKALLIGISVALTSWPAGLPVIQLYPRLQEIYAFLDEIVVNSPGFQEDQQLQSLGTSVALALQDLTDPSKLLQESADQLSFDMKSVSITRRNL